MSVQVRGPSSISGKGTWGIGPFGLDYNYGLSGGTNGIQLQGQLTVAGLAARVQYQSGYQSDSDNLQIQVGFGETFNVAKFLGTHVSSVHAKGAGRTPANPVVTQNCHA